jgi:hypothetical protein
MFEYEKNFQEFISKNGIQKKEKHMNNFWPIPAHNLMAPAQSSGQSLPGRPM